MQQASPILNHLGLFEGIGGFSLAGRWAGWETKGWVEINPFCQTVLKHHFPEAQGFSDIKKFSYAVYKSILRHKGIRDRSIDIITGGFPCQPYSSAGLRKGTDDPRHLWPNMCETIRQFKPTWVVGENVRGIINWSGGLVFEQVQVDLEAIGYQVQAFVLPACGVGAPHRRDRVWFVAYASDGRKPISVQQRGQNKTSDFNSGGESEVKSTPNSQSASSSGLPRGKGTQYAVNGELSCYGHAAYTNSQGPQEWIQSRGGGDKEKDGTLQGCSIDRVCSTSEFTPDPKCEGLEGGDGARKSIRFESGDQKTNPYAYCIRRIQDGSNTEPKQSTQRIPNWRQFPTQRPIRERNDGISNRVVGYLTNALKYEISKTSKDNRIENLQEVWEIVQQKEVWEQIRRLYSLESKDVLFQAMQLYSTTAIRQVDVSPFSEKVSDGILRHLQKYGEFRCSPQGQELQKQRSIKFGDSLSLLPHEVALAARRFETAITKFKAWHRRESIQAYGNAIVPQVAYQIFKAINQQENECNPSNKNPVQGFA